MPYALRSASRSVQNSPSVGSKNSALTVDDLESTTPSATPRKVPQCSKCKRPRAGHPRSGCPFTESPTRAQGAENRGNTLERHLSDALESMAIASPGRALERESEEEAKTFIRNRRRLSAQPPVNQSDSLLSLSTSSSEIVARLLEPGIFGDRDEESDAESGKTARIVRWQETIATPSPVRDKSKGPRATMPGTLIPPTPASSFTSSSTPPTKEEEIISADLSYISDPSHLTTTESLSSHRPPNVVRQPQPLGRTMSAAERDIFVSKLSDGAAATIYIIPKADVADVVAKATSLKFSTAISMSDDENDPQALVILGRNESAVDELFKKIEKENRKAYLSAKAKVAAGQGGSTLKSAAGAAVIGAVTTWAGLAFS
ncbi:hypothetical protein JR316_0004401 [Psilocybe cubensis]|uniref:Uncharacterized protein n=2 Tax=Psilocybe cubensis TaxID=181762 RepID=A0A8H8CJL0_PSICU|nr:hypothetical protein JR316_0004401 [Psilocybe cubensis]KAH9482303.1 hypothetical protein JR316_0004401 [Psilocybe cubensis]